MRNTPYVDRCQLLHLDTLQLRRETTRAMAISDLLTARMDCPDLLRQININAPSRALRMVPPLRPPMSRTNYNANNAISGLQRTFNRVSSVFDFHISREVLRTKIVCMFRNLLNVM